MMEFAVIFMLFASVALIALTAHIKDLIEDIRNELEEQKNDEREI